MARQFTGRSSSTVLRRGELPGADADAEVSLDLTNHRGEIFDERLRAARDPAKGPGWYVKGSMRGSATYVRIVAQPNVPLQRWPKYNAMVVPGWRTKRDAERVIDEMVAAGYGTR